MLLLCCNLLQQMPAKIIKIEHGLTEFSRKWKGAIFATPRPHRAVTVACCLELRWLLTRLCIERCTGRDVEPTSSVPGFVSSLQAEYYYYNDVTKPNSPCFRAGLRISWTAPLNGLLFLRALCYLVVMRLRRFFSVSPTVFEQDNSIRYGPILVIFLEKWTSSSSSTSSSSIVA